ncbi:hypothetical protein AGR1A_Cc20484 [Agrobacterium fabacearum CFBP 5771]|nr:hypothetical protein AGR1C_Cc10700 [Agrobacterium fabacearum TT111]CUW88586.1 hypothetical protein AGR1B_Cc120122 [Agrobacterium fabacearum S56]CVI15577.1 hypothetical protein AGR1A_Cc20484 [Agrobacterium fabacearum CFBP 5771]
MSGTASKKLGFCEKISRQVIAASGRLC